MDKQTHGNEAKPRNTIGEIIAEHRSNGNWKQDVETMNAAFRSSERFSPLGDRVFSDLTGLPHAACAAIFKLQAFVVGPWRGSDQVAQLTVPLVHGGEVEITLPYPVCSVRLISNREMAYVAGNVTPVLPSHKSGTRNAMVPRDQNRRPQPDFKTYPVDTKLLAKMIRDRNIKLDSFTLGHTRDPSAWCIVAETPGGSWSRKVQEDVSNFARLLNPEDTRVYDVVSTSGNDGVTQFVDDREEE
jgi:hypothetical protein